MDPKPHWARPKQESESRTILQCISLSLEPKRSGTSEQGFPISQLHSGWRAKIRKWEKHRLEGKRAPKSELTRPGPPPDRLRGNRLKVAEALNFQSELALISNPFGQLK